MPVIITKSLETFLANPVTFVVFPLTVDEAEDQDVVPEVVSVPADNPFSPNRAG